jgi:multidrug efflux pump subunit AcrA (membrane-fusion protein)
MSRMKRALAAVALSSLALVAPLAAGGAPDFHARRDLDRARAGVVTTARDYRASLDRLLPFREDAVRRASAALETRRRLLETGAVARRDVETAEQALAAAEAELGRTQRDVADAERLLAEAIAAESLPPLLTGGTSATTALIQHRGPGAWSLARVDSVRRFFAERFGRALPISALGQTPVHDRLGFDHRNALDVAVHPDSAEGQALIAWLRSHGVSFLAFRGRVSGEATGAHVHIGEPSPRRAG